MRDSFFSFYTTASKTRLFFYLCFLALAFVYIAVNRMLLSRPEHDISFEVAGLLTVMIVTAPVLYNFILARQKRRSLAKQLAGLMESIRHEGTSDLVMANSWASPSLDVNQTTEILARLQKDSDTVLRREVENYSLLISRIERMQHRFETTLAVGTLVLICTGLATFAAVKGIEPTIIYVAAASAVLSVFIRVLVHSEYNEILNTIMNTVMNEILRRTLVTNRSDLKQTDREQEHP